jgi:hypothetical protein
MRKTFFILLFALVFTSCADMGGPGGSGTTKSDVSLAWDESTSDGVIGYKIYMGEASGSYYRTYNVGNVLTYTIRNLDPGTYYFVCTAYDTSGNESVYSNEIFKTLNP